MSDARDARLSLRVSARQRAVIERAAQARHETLTDYVVRHAVDAATNDLADRRYFELDDGAWIEFTALLERPPVRKPQLEKLLAAPEPWAD